MRFVPCLTKKPHQKIADLKQGRFRADFRFEHEARLTALQGRKSERCRKQFVLAISDLSRLFKHKIKAQSNQITITAD